VSDIVVGKIVEPHQAVVVLAGDDYVALEVDYQDPDAENCDLSNAVVLLAPAGAERLAYALDSAALKAREVAQFIAATTDGSL
jgi:hypothetical protein